MKINFIYLHKFPVISLVEIFLIKVLHCHLWWIGNKIIFLSFERKEFKDFEGWVDIPDHQISLSSFNLNKVKLPRVSIRCRGWIDRWPIVRSAVDEFWGAHFLWLKSGQCFHFASPRFFIHFLFHFIFKVRFYVCAFIMQSDGSDRLFLELPFRRRINLVRKFNIALILRAP